MNKERKAFSLIELMIVLVIIGAFVSIILTNFGSSEQVTRDQSVQVEMYNIRKAFVKYYNDNFPDLDKNGTFHLMARFGVAVLCEKNLEYYGITNSANQALFDSAFVDRDMKNNLGWRGAYITHEGREAVKIGDFTSTECWQNDADYDSNEGTTNTSRNDKSIPVIQDPYGGYYRIVIPKGKLDDGEGKRFLPQYAFIVCTGANKTLQTFSGDFDDDDESETYLQMKPTLDTNDKVGGKVYDDEVLMIFPEFIN